MPKIDSCWIPGFAFVHDETWPFKTTICWWFFKSPLKDISAFLLYCLGLTLSKALGKSRNTPLTSEPSSKEMKISWVIDGRRFTQESQGLYSDSLGEIRPLSKKCLMFYRIWYFPKHCWELEEQRWDNSFSCLFVAFLKYKYVSFFSYPKYSTF